MKIDIRTPLEIDSFYKNFTEPEGYDAFDYCEICGKPIIDCICYLEEN